MWTDSLPTYGPTLFTLTFKINCMCGYYIYFDNVHQLLVVLAMSVACSHSLSLFWQPGMTMPLRKSALDHNATILSRLDNSQGNHCSSLKLVISILLDRMSSGNFSSHIAYTPANDTDDHVTI